MASDRDSYDYFGTSVAMNGDGTKVIVGAKGEDHDVNGGAQLESAGSAYIHELVYQSQAIEPDVR